MNIVYEAWSLKHALRGSSPGICHLWFKQRERDRERETEREREREAEFLTYKPLQYCRPPSLGGVSNGARKWFTAAINLFLISQNTSLSFALKTSSPSNTEDEELDKIKTSEINNERSTQLARKKISWLHARYRSKWARPPSGVNVDRMRHCTFEPWNYRLVSPRQSPGVTDAIGRGPARTKTRRRTPAFPLVNHGIDLRDITRHEHQRWRELIDECAYASSSNQIKTNGERSCRKVSAAAT